MSKPIQGVLKVRRPIHGILPLNSEGKQVDRLVNNVKAADAYKKLLCCIACLRLDVCMMCKLDSLMESTYVQAWENKLEYNYPTIFCCCMVRPPDPRLPYPRSALPGRSRCARAPGASATAPHAALSPLVPPLVHEAHVCVAWAVCPALNSRQVDNVGVIYYDRAILGKADKAGMCKPCCTHMSLCPTCCDMYVRVPWRGMRGRGWRMGGRLAWCSERNPKRVNPPLRLAAVV